MKGDTQDESSIPFYTRLAKLTALTDLDLPQHHGVYIATESAYLSAAHEHKYMGHETANWGGRGLGYMLFNAHLCNQPCSCKVVVGPGAHLCTLLEEWVLGVGMSTLGHKRLCTPRIGDPQVPMTLEHPRCGFAASGLIPRPKDSDRHVSAYPNGPH